MNFDHIQATCQTGFIQQPTKQIHQPQEQEDADGEVVNFFHFFFLIDNSQKSQALIIEYLSLRIT